MWNPRLIADTVASTAWTTIGQRNRKFHGVARETRAWNIIIGYSI